MNNYISAIYLSPKYCQCFSLQPYNVNHSPIMLNGLKWIELYSFYILNILRPGSTNMLAAYADMYPLNVHFERTIWITV